MRRLLALPAASLLVGLSARPAGAVDLPSVGGKPVVVDITNTAVTAYHFNNRNDGVLLEPPTEVDDFYGEFVDRLNVQASWWRLRLGFRLDTSVYFHAYDRSRVASLVADQTPLEQAANQTANSYATKLYEELHSRYLRAIYPSKLFLGYTQPGLDVTAGDFYVQLGRGLVFSVRKIDELAVDTTVRGVKVAADHKLGDVQVGAMFFAGQMNPLRVDEATGRRLNGTNSPLFFGFPQGGALETYDARPGTVFDDLQPGRPSYLEDTAAGGKLEASTRWFTLGANAAGLARQSNLAGYLRCTQGGQDTQVSGSTVTENICGSRFPEFPSTSDVSTAHKTIVNWSGSLNVPSIAKHGDLYVEVAGQAMRDGYQGQVGTPKPNLGGYAVYASGSVNAGPVSISLEGKHYRSFFPLSANIDATTAGFGAPEFALIQYSQPPTAEPTYTEVVSGGSPGVCVTGGRVRVDYRFDRETSVYAWLGRYTSWSEIPGQDLSNGCLIAPSTVMNGADVPRQTNIWDTAAGVDLGFEGRRSHVKAWVGARTSTYEAMPSGASTDFFYEEGYVRYDLVKHLSGPVSLQLQGWHRHRYEPVSFANPWTEGESYTALQWSPHWSAAFGFEYFLRGQCQPGRPATLSQGPIPESDSCFYANGSLQWRSANAGAGEDGSKRYVAKLLDAVGLFVGQTRGAIRCVSGVCRQFPPFSGAKLEVTSRF